ncbi:MAG: MBOAT family O-acyltransferase [Bacteroidia bacterium]
MLFNSIEFAIFLPIVFVIYWFIVSKNLTLQNSFIVLASYVFYGWWDWRFLSLILISSLVDYVIGIQFSKLSNQKKRKLLLFTSIAVNLLILGIFKYYNFFAESFADAFTFFGNKIEPSRLNIILPVGISFYTFQTLSYSIDVYRNKLQPTKDVISFLAFVSFFPQLVAGPIERATNLLPQFYQKRTFQYDKAIDGVKQILWGLFKKMVIADNCAEVANQVFNHSPEMNGSSLLIGALFFTFQIYGDFSGYSDIAIGTSRLFGFSLMQNFAFPYFSRDIAEFWRRWHISLSTWFRDYLYIPIGGSKGGRLKKIRNTFIIFVVSGFWHGANWTFIAWGVLNALYFLPYLLTDKNRTNLDTVAYGKLLPSFKQFFQIAVTFLLTVIAWIFFRSESIAQAAQILSAIFSPSLFLFPTIVSLKMMLLFVLLFIFLMIEWLNRNKKHALENSYPANKILRYLFYFLIVLSIIWLQGKSQDFIYFQF